MHTNTAHSVFIRKPWCVEERAFNKIDNPLHNQVKSHYVPQFDVKQVSQMVNKLGGYMGLKFDDIVCANLTQDYGGHPFLIRQLCSVISDTLKDSQKPVVVNRIEYEKAKPVFEQKYGNEYSAMILDVLKEYYEFEYEMLKHLAIGDVEYFKEHALSSESNYYTIHLIEYGVLYKKGDDFDFKIDTLKKFLISKNEFNKKNLNNEEKLSEISVRRNNLEPRLRKVVRNSMKAVLGEDQAKQKTIKWLHKGDPKFSSYDYKDLFNPNKDSTIEVYLSRIGDLMYANWDECFRNIFDKDKEKFKSRLSIINELRADAHAKIAKDYDMDLFRGSISWFEEKINEYES